MNRRRFASVVRVARRSPAALAVATLGLAFPCMLPLQAQTVNDPALRVEIVAQGLTQPTAMAFLPPPYGAPGEFLILQKNDGRVLRFGGVSPSAMVLDVAVNSASERGLLGIAIDPNFVVNGFVYLYYTESATGADTSDPASVPLGNRVYRYTLDYGPQGTLRDPLLILDLPATPGPNHNGGALAVGPDDTLYTVIGDLNRTGKLQNNALGADPDDTGVIFRVGTSGGAPYDNPFFTPADPTGPMNRYVAYGVRNSFGLAFDPVTGDLWDTENGPDAYDEVNRVVGGFNSGWRSIMGPAARDPQGLNDLWISPGSNYRDPEFSWAVPVAPTALTFAASRILGCGLERDLLVADNNCGQLYRFEPNAARDGLSLSSAPLLDRVADNTGLVCSDEMSEILFGSGFGVITDLKNGPDGRLYVVSLSHGRVYRIGPNPGAFPDADGDGVADACDCAPSTRFNFKAPVEVPRVRVAGPVPTTALGWDPQNATAGEATRYTVVSGDLNALRFTGGFSRACVLGTNVIIPPLTDPQLDPAPGYGFYYLVRAGNVCGTGTYGDGSGTPDPRDELDASTTLPPCALCTGRAGGAVITFDFPLHGQTLRVWITNGPFIDRAKELLATGQSEIPIFNTLLDGRDCDTNWTWHPDPMNVEWAEFAIEVCDGVPSSVEADKAYWFRIGFCPWAARLTSVVDLR